MDEFQVMPNHLHGILTKVLCPRRTKSYRKVKLMDRAFKLIMMITFVLVELFPQPAYLWKATLVQAAPGKLLELIDLSKSRFTADSTIGEPRPYFLRHAQGDKWDLLLLLPMGSYAEYFKPERVARRTALEETSKQLRERIESMIAWQEDVLVYGPNPGEVKKSFEGSSFFHAEMFIGLAGKGSELYKEREMENAYQRALKRPENLIFVRDQGAAWTLFTLGAYRDLKHYAASADISEKDQEAAARLAGFESSRHIGPYLRTLIREHHDTLLNLVR